VSNLERKPVEVLLVDQPSSEASGSGGIQVQVLEPREVPLGGPRALLVRRTLPQRARSLVGAWCFADAYGPTLAAEPRAMNTPPHPHTGLQTVSWLYAGQIEHRDSTGAHAMIVPGQVNLMTAGAGVQHSEVAIGDGRSAHGVQLWTALPDSDRGVAPFFEHYVPEPVEYDDAVLRVFVGSLVGSRSTVTTYSPLLGAQIDLPAGGVVRLPVDPSYEHGLLVDSGRPSFHGAVVPDGHLAVVAMGRSELVIVADDELMRALLIGGAPLAEQIVMWWNFVGRSHEEIVAFREQWQADVIADGTRTGRFGHVDGYDGRPLPAPELPNVRLRPRD
jgi:quercetin 2,3-dioxygenase